MRLIRSLNRKEAVAVRIYCNDEAICLHRCSIQHTLYIKDSNGRIHISSFFPRINVVYGMVSWWLVLENRQLKVHRAEGGKQKHCEIKVEEIFNSWVLWRH